jgi:holo-[acyl-carrier protein] synthase
MRIIGHGIDIVETSRIAHMIEAHGDRFLQRCFTAGELAYAQANRRRTEHLAGRFAAKEAVLKVLGTGWRGGIAWTDVEVLREPSGQPTVALHGLCRTIAADLGIAHWWLSISHIEPHAMASAIAATAG